MPHELAEVVDGVARVRRTAADAKNEQPAAALAQAHEFVAERLDLACRQGLCDVADLPQILGDVFHLRNRPCLCFVEPGVRASRQITVDLIIPPQIPTHGRNLRHRSLTCVRALLIHVRVLSRFGAAER